MTIDPMSTHQDSETAKFSAGRRRINVIWESTQAFVAIAIVLTTCAGVFVGRVVQHETAIPFPSEWWTVVGLVIGFYFGRTNHARPEIMT